MIHEFEHDYLGYNWTRSRCNVKIFSDDGDNYICFENLGIGTSVTNASEKLATQIVAKMHMNPGDCRFFESYRENDNDTFDEIEYTWKSKIGHDGQKYWEAENAKWKPGPIEIEDIFF